MHLVLSEYDMYHSLIAILLDMYIYNALQN